MARVTLIEDEGGAHVPTVAFAGARALCDATATTVRCLRPSASSVVTCPACVAIVRQCRGLHTAGEKQKGKASASAAGFAFADWFAATLPADVSKATGWREKWAQIYDDMIRLDGRTHDQIMAVCRFARAHSFWGAQFLSPAKLRKRDSAAVTFFDRFRAMLKPVDAARLVQQAGQETEGRSTARIVDFS